MAHLSPPISSSEPEGTVHDIVQAPLGFAFQLSRQQSRIVPDGAQINSSVYEMGFVDVSQLSKMKRVDGLWTEQIDQLQLIKLLPATNGWALLGSNYYDVTNEDSARVLLDLPTVGAPHTLFDGSGSFRYNRDTVINYRWAYPGQASGSPTTPDWRDIRQSVGRMADWLATEPDARSNNQRQIVGTKLNLGAPR